MNRHERRKQAVEARRALASVREVRRNQKLGRGASDAGIPAQACPHCGALIEAASNGSGHRAAPGHICVCIHCAGASQFGPGLELVAMTESEVDGLNGSETVREHQRWIRKAIEKMS